MDGLVIWSLALRYADVYHLAILFNVGYCTSRYYRISYSDIQFASHMGKRFEWIDISFDIEAYASI